ncbi:MAG: nucleoside triphosphate pyrophosphohydrolase, partial [Betaproteobacteria bacterium]
MRHVRFNTVPVCKKAAPAREAKVDNRNITEKFGELLDIMARLRSETGCPWDKEQTHTSLKPCLLEETYELLDALDND